MPRVVSPPAICRLHAEPPSVLSGQNALPPHMFNTRKPIANGTRGRRAGTSPAAKTTRDSGGWGDRA